MKNKNVYIIAGSNGAGKTTFAREFLPDYVHCPHFINADLIARGLSPFYPQSAVIKAGKLVLQQIEEFTNRGVNFGFETTLSGKTYLNYFKNLKKQEYKLRLFFLWIPDTQLALARIKNRVSHGGHNVPNKDVKRRFKRSIDNFFNLYLPLADTWLLFDNSEKKPKLIAKRDNLHIDVRNEILFQKILNSTGVKL